MRSFCLRTLLALTLLLALASPARAQNDASARALAVQLFDEAEALFAKGILVEACPKYAESYRLDPQLGVLIYLAECYEKNGQLASAWGTYREADEMARKRGDARGEQARKRAAALEPRLSYLVLRVPEAARVEGLQLYRSGVPVPEVLWGSRAAVDAGKQRIEARAPGYLSWQTEIDIVKQGKAAEVEVPPLESAPSAAPSKAAALPVGTTSSSGSSTQRIAAIAVGGLGVVGLGVGGFFGLGAQSAQSDAEPLCNDDDFCTPRGDQLRTSAKSKALVATIASGVGAAALLTAGVLWFTAPSVEPKAATARRSWALGPSRDAWGMEVSHAF